MKTVPLRPSCALGKSVRMKRELWRPPGARPWDGLVPQPRAFQALAGGYAYRTPMGAGRFAAFFQAKNLLSLGTEPSKKILYMKNRVCNYSEP